MAFNELIKVDRPMLVLDNDTTMSRADTSSLSSSSPPSPYLPSTSTTPPCPSLGPTHPQNTTPTSSDPRAASGEEGRGGGRRRKAPHPQKTLSLMDPNFRGVTLCFQIAVQGGHSRLLITPFYSKNLARFQRRRRRLCFNSESDPDPGSHSPQADRCAGEGELQPQQTPSPFLVSHRARSPAAAGGAPKSCASCATRRTPLWRDAEDGTPLCNACGIRYRKYRVRCGSCWHIPRKDNKVFPACSQCGGVLRLAQARKC